MKFEVAEDYLDLARTFLYRGEKVSAKQNFERGMKMLDELIEKDPSNTEFKQFQLANLTTFYGDSQIKTGDFDGALKSYRRAVEKAEIYSKNIKDIVWNENYITQRLGDIYYFKAEKDSGAAQKNDLAHALGFYRQSHALLKPDRLDHAENLNYLNENIAFCEAKIK